MFQDAQKTWSWKAENKEKMEAEICPYSPRLTAGHFAGRDCYLIRNPSHQSCLSHCQCIALTHSCLCSLQPGTKDPVRTNGKLEKDHVAPVTMQTQMKSACWGDARLRVCCEGVRTCAQSPAPSYRAWGQCVGAGILGMGTQRQDDCWSLLTHSLAPVRDAVLKESGERDRADRVPDMSL